MRYIINDKSYVLAVSFGCELSFADCDCTEYTGKVPSGWNSLEEWYEDEGGNLWRWKIVGGNLTLDSSAVAPVEGQWGAPGWKSVEARTGQALVFNDGAQIWINTGTDQVPSVILLECTADVQSSNFLVSSMRLELTDGEITSMYATVSMNGYLHRATAFTGMSVTLSSGVLRIYCNTETCKFYYNANTQVFDYYDCYLMY